MLPVTRIQQKKFKYFNSLGYLTYRYPVSFLVFSSPYWSPLFIVLLLFLCSCIIFPTIPALLTAMQNG
jgi:hypothetical protein